MGHVMPRMKPNKTAPEVCDALIALPSFAEETFPANDQGNAIEAIV
jgi:hypothetical protein